MKIVLTGGGTGGHITPILAVAHELKLLYPNLEIIYIGERSGKFASMTEGNSDIDKIYKVYAGKFRRYHGESWLRRITDVKTNLLNARDLIYTIIGVLQSLVLIRRINPDATLLKGGYVGVPVGVACAISGLSYVTHDSDAVPGLANRLVARWATYHATAFPAKFYDYAPASVKQVGVLVSKDHKSVDDKQQASYKNDIGISKDDKLLLVTGGSSGAASINRAIRSIIDDLLTDNKELFVIHQTGKGKRNIYDDYTHERLRIEELLFPLYEFTGASDLVVTRAGANTLAELGAQGRPCIVIPNPLLTGGHQIKNAQYYERKDAVLVLRDKDITRDARILRDTIEQLLSNDKKRRSLGEKLQNATSSDAALKLAKLLITVASSGLTKNED